MTGPDPTTEPDGPTETTATGDAARQDASPDDTGRQDAFGLVELPALPAAGALYRRAVTGLLPGLGSRRSATTLPKMRLAVRGVRVDRAHLAEYDRVCGFRLGDQLPATYPHVMGFPLALRLMTAAEFPVPLTGIVHVANRITVHRPIDAGEALDFVVHAADLRPHERGRQLDVLLTAEVQGEPVWRGVSTYLSKERTATNGARRDRGDRPAPPVASARWRVEPRTGREYARVSGDHNPIHTSRVGARIFGFPGPIAHGMWSKARCLAALAGRLPESFTVDVAFKLPVPLPSTVAFSASRLDSTTSTSTTTTADGAGSEWEFALHDARTGRPHLTGSLH